jgi:RimJ/RimL family protein N-acetyltransferase
MRGAARSPGGKPVIALLSTAREGTVSRIVPRLKEGAGVVTTRADVHYVVTEFGVAYLHGKSVRERALALIHIAHPKFREELLRAARERKIVHPQQISLPPNIKPYPRKYETSHRFKNGVEIFFRPIRPTDEGLLKELFYSHSPETILNRYFTPMRYLPEEQVQRFVTLDYQDNMAIIGTIPHEGREKMICVGRYFRNPANREAEFAITIHDEFQKKGIGTFLLKYLAKIALDSGITAFTADILSTNTGMMKLVQKLSTQFEVKSSAGTRNVRVKLDKN